MTSQAIVETSPKTRSNFTASLRKFGPQIRDFFVHALGQVRIYQKAYAGIMHGLIFWGVTVQVLGTAINLMQMQLFVPFVELPFPRGGMYLAFELVMDLAGVAILLGVGMAFFRRYVLRPKTLETRPGDVYALVLLTLIPVAGFTVEGMRLIGVSPEWSVWSPVGSAVARLMLAMGLPPEEVGAQHPYMFWIHAGLGLALVASIPYTKLRHLMTTPLNVIFHPRRPEGALEKIEDIDTAELLGVGKVQEFAPAQLLSFDACVRCGRCEEACPASASGMPYSPKDFIQALREAAVSTLAQPNGNTDQELVGGAISDEMAWYCTTCGACLAKCPAFVRPVDEVVDLRRYQALTTGKLPKPVADTLRNMERQGNPWGMPPDGRMAWAEGLEVRELAAGDSTDVLLFLGCASAFDERNRKVAQAFARLLQLANVDFGVLGFDEMCCGETARRMGHEYLFQELAKQNIEALSQINFKRVVTQCPHCFNTLKNEYPQLGGDFKVQHYTEFLAELNLPAVHTASNGAGPKITFHDSCYLGRYNQIYKEPRQLLNQAGIKLVEMEARGEDSFCCGGGGGQMWMETDANTRINHRRLAQAQASQAGVVATACPYCLLMFDDAIRSKGLGEQMQVVDISELLVERLETQKQ